MLPKLKERTNSISQKTQYEKQIQAQISQIGEGRGCLIILIMDNEEFIHDFFQNPRYIQFLKYKEFLNDLQIKQFISHLQDEIIQQISNSYLFHYCTFQQEQKQIDLVNITNKEIYDILFEFSERTCPQKQFNYIFGVDFNMIHKTKFKQLFYMSDIRIDCSIIESFQPIKYSRLRAFSNQSVNYQTNNQEQQDSQETDPKFQQIAVTKRNNEIKKYLREQNQKKGELIKKNTLIVTKLMQTEKIDIQREQLELPEICEQVLSKFQLIFMIDDIPIEKELFSQFLLLCEMTMLYTKNKLLQVQIQKIEISQRLNILLKSLHFDFKILKSMNSKLLQLNTTITKCLLRFLKQGFEYDRQNRLFWIDFQRFKQFYIDKKWNVSDFRLFLMLINDENPILATKLLKVQQTNVQRVILQLQPDTLQSLVYSLLF